MKTLILIVLVGLFSASSLWARSFSTYTIQNVPEEESLETIMAKFGKDYELHTGNRSDAYETYLKAWNPQVTDWDKIPTGTKIYIESPSLPLGPGETAPSLIPIYEKDDGISRYKIKNYKLLFLLTSSIGDFEEVLPTPDHEHISSTQNSHITLGFAGTANFVKSRDYISASVYYSKLNASQISGTIIQPTELNVPSEYGFNAYWARPYKRTDFAYYGGFDIEDFATYNTMQFVQHAPLGFNENRFLFATFGAEQALFVAGKRLTFKASLAYSILSSTSSPDENDRFKGYRLLLFANYKIYGRYGIHLLYKHHQLKGPTDMQINRFGIGLNALLF